MVPKWSPEPPRTPQETSRGSLGYHRGPPRDSIAPLVPPRHPPDLQNVPQMVSQGPPDPPNGAKIEPKLCPKGPSTSKMEPNGAHPCIKDSPHGSWPMANPGIKRCARTACTNICKKCHPPGPPLWQTKTSNAVHKQLAQNLKILPLASPGIKRCAQTACTNICKKHNRPEPSHLASQNLRHCAQTACIKSRGWRQRRRHWISAAPCPKQGARRSKILPQSLKR